MYIKLKISTISSTSISPANIVDKHSLYLSTHYLKKGITLHCNQCQPYLYCHGILCQSSEKYLHRLTIYTLHIQLGILTGAILVVHPECPAQLLLRVSAARHVGCDHELLEVDAAVPVLVENTEQLLQKLVASLALCR